MVLGDAMRSSIRKMWRLPEYPGNLLIRMSYDLLVLLGLVLLGLVLLGLVLLGLGAVRHGETLDRGSPE
jgi:membrane protein